MWANPAQQCLYPHNLLTGQIQLRLVHQMKLLLLNRTAQVRLKVKHVMQRAVMLLLIKRQCNTAIGPEAALCAFGHPQQKPCIIGFIFGRADTTNKIQIEFATFDYPVAIQRLQLLLEIALNTLAIEVFGNTDDGTKAHPLQAGTYRTLASQLTQLPT